jgi:cathepsin L
LAYESIIAKGGLTTEKNYPYKGKDAACIFDTVKTPPAAVLSGYTNIPTNAYDELIEALYTEGPISVSVDASKWYMYSKGVYTGCNTSKPDIDHAVLLVGYGTDPKLGPYWTIRNSWGSSWGESGHIRIKRTPANELCGWDTTPLDGSGCEGGPDKVWVCGMCGILYDNTFPNVASTTSTE